MTSFGGVFALEPGREIAARTSRELADAMSRVPGDKVELASGRGYAVAFLDLGMLPGHGRIADASGACSFLAGDLLLRPRAAAKRDDDLRLLHDAWLREDESLLATARGSFAVAQIEPTAGRLRLAVDVIGARSLYVAFSDGLVYFATALRILEALSDLPRRVDVRGLLELSAFNYPLSTRTQYEGVELLDGCESVRVDRGEGVRRLKYMRWGDLRPSKLGQDELPGVLYDCFQEAVRWRLEDESSVVSFFSGGLDSRCVTASLLAEGVRVHTINVAPERSLDLILGRTAAERLGTRHYEYSSGRPDGVNSRVVAGYRAWLSGIGAAEFDRPPTAVWTGNGGSVAVGHVYLDDPMVTLMRQGRRPEAVRAYLRKNRIELTPRAFRPGMRSTVKSCCFDGVLEQVQRLDCHDEGRRLHLFLMLNDQRRHLTDHYEDIDLRRLELINPFFDARFLRLVMAEPVRPFLAHRFYNSWLKTFPFALDSMPWQAYADHVPCPLPMPSGLRTQWEGGYYAEDAVKAALNEVLQRSRLALASEHFPRTVLRAPALRMAWWLTRAGMGDYSYLLNIATAWTEYASRAGSGATKTKLEALSAHA